MARYDRIARLAPPARNDAFPGWLALRDLEGREREAELGRRARLRFLALRPAHRVIRHGFDGTDRESLHEQVASVRRELDQLPSNDTERARIAAYLKALDEGTPLELATAAITLGETAEADGHGYAAEEFYRTALELSRRCNLSAPRVDALRSLGRVLGAREAWDEARPCLSEAMSLADSERLLEAGAEAAAALCTLELAARRSESAVEAGWRAVERSDPGGEARAMVLLDMGTAFRRLGLRSAADACYQMVIRSAAPSVARRDARLGIALSAAEAGDADAARAHLRQAMETAHAAGLDNDVPQTEDLLSRLEGRAASELESPPAQLSDGTRSIARQIESMERALVASN